MAKAKGVSPWRLGWGRFVLSSIRQRSIVRCAASRLLNRCSFRHSSRRRPIRLSTTEGLVLLYILDPEAERTLPATLLARLFRLTPTEATLACKLVQGRRLEEIAAEHGVRITTARTQLQALFSKTDTKRQAELVRLLTPVTLLAHDWSECANRN